MVPGTLHVIETGQPSYLKEELFLDSTSGIDYGTWVSEEVDIENTPFIAVSQLNLNELILEGKRNVDKPQNTPLTFHHVYGVTNYVAKTGEWLQPIIASKFINANLINPILPFRSTSQYLLQPSHFIAYKPVDSYTTILTRGYASALDHFTPLSSLTNFSDINFRSTFNLESIEDIISSVLSLTTLKQDWDGYGAFPSNINTASKTISFLIEIKEFTKNVTDLYPNPHGTISIEWENFLNERMAVEIGEDKFSFYVKYTSKTLITGEFVLANSAAAECSHHLKKLFN